RASCTRAALASSSGVGAASMSSLVTVAQWCPTGQYWYRFQPSRTALSDASGIQIVVKRCPAEHRTGVSNRSNMMSSSCTNYYRTIRGRRDQRRYENPLPEFREIGEDLGAGLGGRRIVQVLEGAAVEQEWRVPLR